MIESTIYLLGMIGLLLAGLLVSHGLVWLARKLLGLPNIDY